MIKYYKKKEKINEGNNKMKNVKISQDVLNIYSGNDILKIRKKLGIGMIKFGESIGSSGNKIFRLETFKDKSIRNYLSLENMIHIQRLLDEYDKKLDKKG
jgi:hypothetical protein